MQLHFGQQLLQHGSCSRPSKTPAHSTCCSGAGRNKQATIAHMHDLHQQRQLLRPAERAVACAAGPAGTPGIDDHDDDDDDDDDTQVTCAPAFVTVDQGNPHYSAFSIDVDDYPGLLRVVSWVFNGLGCRVHNAVLKTDAEGRASDVFWVTDLRGRKLSEADAADVSERLEDFLSFCAPPDSNDEFKEFTCGDISISNVVHPTLTQVTIQADLFSPGLLLEIASIIHGQGLSVVEAVIRGGSESPITPDMVSDAAAIPDPPSGRRVMRFWLKKGRRGQKLEYDDVSALVYTLRAVLGGGNLTTQPPNTELTALSCGSSGGECTPGATSGSDDPCDAEAATTGVASSKGGSRGKGGVTL